MSKGIGELQGQFCSDYDRRKLCSYDLEVIDGPTKPLVHQAARFLVFISGDAVMNINGVNYHVGAKSFVAILPWESSEITEVKKPLNFIKIIYNYNFANQFLRIDGTKSPSLLEPIRRTPAIQLNDREFEMIIDITEAIKSEVGVESLYEVSDEKELSTLLVGNKIAEMLIYYKRFMMNKEESSISRYSEPSMFRYIYAHLSDYVTLESLSSLFKMKPDAVAQYIFDVTGMSLSTLTNELRIAKTCDLLIHTDLPLTDIAYLTGFNDASHLVKNFSSRMYVSPNEYRQIYQRYDDVLYESEKMLGYNLTSYIYEHYTENLKPTEMANRFNVSVIEMNKALLYVIEMNYDEFLNYLRVNKASELLLNTDEPIIDISVEVGYNNVKTFSRNFVKLKNMSPSDYRKAFILQKDGESIMADA